MSRIPNVSQPARLAQEAQAVFDAADHENRALTADERVYVKGLLDRAEERAGYEGRLKATGLLNTSAGSHSVGAGAMGLQGEGPGDAFVASEGWKSISDPSTRGQTWTTGAVELPPFGFQTKAGTVFEGFGGQGSGLIPVPQVIPGQVLTLFQPLGVSDVFDQGQTTSSSVRYVIEGTATNNAAGVAEGGAKPASDLALSTVDEPVRKVATTLTVSDELLDDVAQVQTYLNARLTLFVQLEEERALLRGAGTNELVGVMDSTRGINVYSRGTVDNNAVALAKVIANTRGSSFLEPDAIVMHPSNFLSTRLLTDGAGQFYGGGPFTGSYGGGAASNTPLFGDQLWGKRVVLSTFVGPGTALVGSFGQGARIMRRGGPTVEATNSHSDYFTHDLVAIRCESRAALCLFRPGAFTEVRGLN